MANFVLVESTYNDNGRMLSKEVTELHDLLPTSWKNISNFHVYTDDVNMLKQYGWYKPVRATIDFDTTKYWIRKELYHYDMSTDSVIETFDLVEIVPPEPDAPVYPSWETIRSERDQKMRDFEWRYLRYDRQVRMSLPTTDNITDLDTYMQALADITLQDIENIVWPEYIVTEIPQTEPTLSDR